MLGKELKLPKALDVIQNARGSAAVATALLDVSERHCGGDMRCADVRCHVGPRCNRSNSFDRGLRSKTILSGAAQCERAAPVCT